jgi:hypothetical protein
MKDELNKLAETMDWLWYNNDGLSEPDRLDSVIAAVAKIARALAEGSAMTHTTKSPAELRAEIEALQAALTDAMEAVDPLLTEAREAAAKVAEENGHGAWARSLRRGLNDTHDDVRIALAALRLAAPAEPVDEAGECIAGRLCDWDREGEPPVPLMQEAAAYIRATLNRGAWWPEVAGSAVMNPGSSVTFGQWGVALFFKTEGEARRLRAHMTGDPA